MNKLLYLLLPFFILVLSSCNNDYEELNPALIKGTWEVIAKDNLGYTAIYAFETIKDFDNQGILEVKYLHTNGSMVEEIPIRKYEWHAYGPQNNNGILDISIWPLGMTYDDPDFFEENYIISILTSSKMVWKGSSGYPTSIEGRTIEFVRLLQ